MAALYTTSYRGYTIESRAVSTGQRYSVDFTLYPEGFTLERVTRSCDGRFLSEGEAHADALPSARRLIDLILADRLPVEV
jgi:hypothetical protein